MPSILERVPGLEVYRVTPSDLNRLHILATVFLVVRHTLCIAPPILICDEEPLAEQIHFGRDRMPGSDLPSEQRGDTLTDFYTRGEDPGTKLGTHVDQDTITVHTDPGPGGGQVAGPGLGPSSRLPSRRDDLDTWSPTRSSSNSSTSSSSGGGPIDDGNGPMGDDVDDERDQDVVDEGLTCGTTLRHISKAGEYLLDPEWNEEQDDDDIADVEAAYQSYVDWMTSQGHDPDEDPFTLPEEQPIDRPPDD